MASFGAFFTLEFATMASFGALGRPSQRNGFVRRIHGSRSRRWLRSVRFQSRHLGDSLGSLDWGPHCPLLLSLALWRPIGGAARARTHIEYCRHRREKSCINLRFLSRTPSLTVTWLVELDLERAGHAEVGHEAVTLIDDGPGEFDTARLELGHCRLDIVAVE
jgi:hypothetical protein